MVYPYNDVQVINKNEWITDTCSDKWKKPKATPCMITFRKEMYREDKNRLMIPCAWGRDWEQLEINI